MDFEGIDFEGTQQTTQVDGTNGNGNQTTTPVKESDTTSLDGKKTVQDINEDGTTPPDDSTASEGNDTNDTSLTGELNAGDTIEFDGETYTVNENGDIVDKDNKVFKQKAEVADWLKSVETEDASDSNELDIKSIQDKIGVSVTDEAGKPMEFTNDAEGVSAYVKSVMDLKTEEIQQATLNRFFNDNPYVKQFVDYVQLTGSPRGFGEIPDRSGIEINKDDVAQQEAIIRMAAQEFGNKSINDNYIKYLKDTGSLYDEAVNQLEALVNKDNQVKQQIEQQAAAARQQEENEVKEYWEKVNNVITSRNIAGYKLPNSFIRERNGQKVTLTPQDFYDYLSKQVDVDADGNGLTGYQKDLNQLTQDEIINRDLLDAWLIFTGGSYKDLVDMAIKEEQVKRLKIKSKEQRTSKTVKVIKANQGKVDLNDILL